MKLLLLIVLVFPFMVDAQNTDSSWIVKNYIKKEQYITMRDGVRLFTSIYIPRDTSEKHPVLIKRTPYSCSPYGDSIYFPFWDNHYKTYLKENYIMVIQDVRGKFMSEGMFMDVRPFNPDKKTNKDTDEASDTYDTVDWLMKNIDNNNGKAGVFGISYPGYYAVQAALSNHAAIVAVSPQAPVTDWFIGDDFHHNGAFMLMDAFNFYVVRGFGAPRTEPHTTGFKTAYTPSTKDSYSFFLRTGALPNFTKLTGDSIVFWNDMMNHPDYDAWWKVRNTRIALHNVKPAMLTVGGLYDAEDCFGAWAVYKAIEKQSPSTDNKLVMGPWWHGQWSGDSGRFVGNVQFGTRTSDWFADSIEIPFFNHHLKGKGTVESIKEASVFFTGENNWKQFSRWPPAGSVGRELFLHSGGKLNWTRSIAGKTFSEYVSDPSKPVPYNEGVRESRTIEYMTDDQRFASNRPDVLVFETDTLTEDLTLAGPVTADLKVSNSSTDADFVVKLIDVYPDHFSYGPQDKYIMNGYQQLVRGEVFRGRYRNSFEKPEPFVPGKISTVKYLLPDVAHTFKKGHRIMIHVQSSWFPLVDRNPQQYINIYRARNDQFRKATIRIHHGGAQFSSILLPVLRKPS